MLNRAVLKTSLVEVHVFSPPLPERSIPITVRRGCSQDHNNAGIMGRRRCKGIFFPLLWSQPLFSQESQPLVFQHIAASPLTRGRKMLNAHARENSISPTPEYPAAGQLPHQSTCHKPKHLISAFPKNWLGSLSCCPQRATQCGKIMHQTRQD